jgi:hypothetical protein
VKFSGMGKIFQLLIINFILGGPYRDSTFDRRLVAGAKQVCSRVLPNPFPSPPSPPLP